MFDEVLGAYGEENEGDEDLEDSLDDDLLEDEECEAG